jgi:hypothetical protein
MGEKRNAYRLLVGKLEGKRQLGSVAKIVTSIFIFGIVRKSPEDG